MKLFNVLFFCAGLLASNSVWSLNKEPESRNLKWVLAHEPTELFTEAAAQFANEVKEKTKGKIKIEILSLKEYSKKYAKGKTIYPSENIENLRKGTIDLTQTYTTELGQFSNDLFVLDLPFLFKSHQHATAVLEGAVGDRLLESLDKYNMHGLAFTYSGGYRIIPSTKEIKKLDDLRGLRISTSRSPVAHATLEALGMSLAQIPLDHVSSAIQQGKLDASELTYPRIYPLKLNSQYKYVLESFHSLFLTSVVINNELWKSFSVDEQNIFKSAAVRAARAERELSVSKTEEVRKKCEKDGIVLTTLSAAEAEKFSKLIQPVYTRFEPTFTKGLVKDIQNQK